MGPAASPNGEHKSGVAPLAVRSPDRDGHVGVVAFVPAAVLVDVVVVAAAAVASAAAVVVVVAAVAVAVAVAVVVVVVAVVGIREASE